MNGAQPVRANVPGPGTCQRILVIEDEVLFGRAVRRQLERAGYECSSALSLQDGRQALSNFQPHVVLLDLRLPDGSGLDLLEQLSASGARLPVIVMTAYGEVTDAVQAMKLGAADYLKKPVDLAELQLAVEAALKTEEIKNQLDCSRERESHAIESPLLLGECPSIGAIRTQIRELAALAGNRINPGPTVLLLGETGTGKDVAARLLHVCGPARTRPFVHVDCAALPRELMEAELFGNEKGAYTGAQRARAGLIEAAEDGTLFLDEIGELPLELQGKLLNMLERRRTRRLGSTQERPVYARFIAASNRDLAQMIGAGRVRADLYYRLNVISVTLPPLKSRGEDILLLTRHYAAQASRRYRVPEPRFEPKALELMMRYTWPGNVRELKHLVERAMLLSRGRAISPCDLALSGPQQNTASFELDGLTLDEAERILIEHALAGTHQNISEAARRLGISRMTLRYRLQKHRIRARSD